MSLFFPFNPFLSLFASVTYDHVGIMCVARIVQESAPIMHEACDGLTLSLMSIFSFFLGWQCLPMLIQLIAFGLFVLVFGAPPVCRVDLLIFV